MEYLFTKTHEWIRIEGEIGTIGLSEFAVTQMTDITNIEFPKIGKKLNAKDIFGEIESVKSVFDLFSPCAGEVIEINDWLIDKLEEINKDPLLKGWLIRIKLDKDYKIDHLMNLEEYQEQLADH